MLNDEQVYPKEALCVCVNSCKPDLQVLVWLSFLKGICDLFFFLVFFFGVGVGINKLNICC